MKCHAISGLSFGVLLAVLPGWSSGGPPKYRAGFAAQMDQAGNEFSYGASIEVGGYRFGPAYNPRTDEYYYEPSYAARSYDVPANNTPRRYFEPTPYFTPYNSAPEDYDTQDNAGPMEAPDGSY